MAHTESRTPGSARMTHPVYFANPTAGTRPHMEAGLIGAIATPAQGNLLDGIPMWTADNGCYGKGYPGDDGFLAWLEQMAPHVDRCWFAVSPDVVGDAAATWERSAPMLPRIRALGYPVAYAAQNGLEHLQVPWDEFSVLFLGGDDTFKLGPFARAITRQARARGKGVHMGRVNSLRRYRYAEAIGCTSVDGTYLTFGPDVNLPTLLGWARDVRDQGTLFRMPA
jgi:hypothetical protein